MSVPRCSIVITAYNAVEDLPPCLDGLLAQDYPDFEIVLVDNASEDNTPEVAALYKQVRYVRLRVNRAITGGYNAGADYATGDILVFINADTVPQSGWLANLVQPLIESKDIGLTTSRILLADAPHLVNTCGNDVTWTGLTVCRGLGQQAEQWRRASEVSAVSGAAFAIRRELFYRVGRFDETFKFYFDDTDLSLRAQLAGYRIWYTPDSLIWHRYKPKFSANKVYYLERNRWFMMMKVMRRRTLLLLLPGLTLGEAMAWLYALLQGRAYLKAKVESWEWLWYNRQIVRLLRHKTQAQRKVPDQELLRLWSPQLHFTGAMPDKVARLAEKVTRPILRTYGAFCRLLAAW